MIDVQELTDRLLNVERKLREEAKNVTSGPVSLHIIGKAEGVALARSYVEEMSRW